MGDSNMKFIFGRNLVKTFKTFKTQINENQWKSNFGDNQLNMKEIVRPTELMFHPYPSLNMVKPLPNYNFHIILFICCLIFFSFFVFYASLSSYILVPAFIFNYCHYYYCYYYWNSVYIFTYTTQNWYFKNDTSWWKFV